MANAKKRCYKLQSKACKTARYISLKSNHTLSWSECMKQGWQIAKNGITTKDFSAIYKKYYNQVYFFVNGKLFNNTIVAEEVTNDVFTKAYNHLENYDVMRSQLNTWLFTIAKNAVIDYSRSKQYKKSTQVDLIDGYVDETGKETYQIGSDMMDGENCLINKELGNTLNNAIGTLNEKEQAIFRMYAEGEKYINIAKVLDIPENTIKVTVMRCKAKLQKKLQGVY